MWLVCVGLIALAWWRTLRTKAPAQPDAASPPPTPPSPPTPPGDGEPARKRPAAAVTTLATIYTVLTAWTFLAWYGKHKNRAYKWGGDGWLGPTTYAGGADKLGHAWSTMSLTRMGTYILTALGGFDRKKSAIVSASFAEFMMFLVEVKDGFYYEFSFSDMTGNTCGALLGWLLDTFPRADELLAYRVEYFPSEMYMRQVSGATGCPKSSCSRWNFAEDYSGETYLLALHLGGIPAIRNRRGTWSRFVDVAIGFDARNYKPLPDLDLAVDRPARQELFAGLAFNAQGFFDWLLEDRPSPAAQRARTVLHGMFNVFQLPFTSLPIVRTGRERPPQKIKFTAGNDRRGFTTRGGARALARSLATRPRSRSARSQA